MDIVVPALLLFSNNATIRAFTEDNPGDPPLTTLRGANGDEAPIPTFPSFSIFVSKWWDV